MKNLRRTFTVLFAAAFSMQMLAQREDKLINQDWSFRFSHQVNANAARRVDLPHTWNAQDALGGKHDYKRGIGNYTKKIFIRPEWQSKRLFLRFEGANCVSNVFVNGKHIGEHRGGYGAFVFEITDKVEYGKENTLLVRVNNGEQLDVMPLVGDFNFYGGIYRDVHLLLTDNLCISPLDYASSGVYLIQQQITDKQAAICARINLSNGTGELRKAVLRLQVNDGKKTVYETEKEVSMIPHTDVQVENIEFILKNPRLWNGTQDPFMYQTVVTLIKDGKELDKVEQPLGVRYYITDPDKGFFLNGKKTYFKGACMHHDLGPLGAAVNDAAIRRQIRILKDMGCNAIRTSHNMPAPELIKACDEMGMMVMAESFDEWKKEKCMNGYHKVFDEWAEKDLVNLLHQYRNHPSIVMWCIGNEVSEQWGAGELGAKITRFLRDICHREDPTRPVTMGMDGVDAVIKNNMAATLDIPGFNYRPHKYQLAYDKLPQQIILGSETASTVSSRGVYKFPVTRQWMKKYDDHQSSSYDVESCAWSNLPEDDFIQHEDLPYCIGEFVWTGFDYLGEPTPYYTDWPSHSSLFGVVDLAGLPKDRYFLYRSHWNKEQETLHVLPHWNWEGREGEVTPVFVYTNYPSAELFINGKSQGRRTKDLSVTVHNSADSTSIFEFKRQQRYRLMWMDTRYEPGTVKVVAYDKTGKAVAETEMHTAGKPHHIELVADRNRLRADGKDLAFVTVKVVDKDGNLCPDAQTLIQFRVKGEGSYRAGANGNPASLEQFHLPQMHVFNGMMTAIVQSSDKAGKIVLEATGKGLKKALLTVETE